MSTNLCGSTDVNDTYTIFTKDHNKEFIEYLNNIDPDIKFTIITEEVEYGGLAFLDMNIVQKKDSSLQFLVYHKKTHTDQYLSFKSNHHLIHMFGVVHKLYNRAETLVAEKADKQKEKHIQKAMNRCDYPDWTIKLVTNPNLGLRRILTRTEILVRRREWWEYLTSMLLPKN